jgi:hypothetical protein
VNAINPELDVAVLARDPADPRIEAPASEQPRWDIGCPRGGYDLADNAQWSFSALVHGLILPGTVAVSEADGGPGAGMGAVQPAAALDRAGFCSDNAQQRAAEIGERLPGLGSHPHSHS